MTNSERIQMLKTMQAEAKAAEADAKLKLGKFNDALGQFLRDNKVPESFNILDLIETFSPRVIL